MHRFFSKLGMLAAITAVLFSAHVAHAHERRMVGAYEFVVGFIVEPAIEGEKNGIDLRVTVPAETEDGEPTPVEGVEETLQVEVTHVPSGVSEVMDLRGLFRDPGHYTADLILTAPGQYRFRFFGTVEGMEVDEVFESGEDTFSDVNPAGEFQFPEQAPQMREVESAVRGVQETTQQAVDAAASARTLAITALVVGVLGVLVGIGGVVIAVRRR